MPQTKQTQKNTDEPTHETRSSPPKIEFTKPDRRRFIVGMLLVFLGIAGLALDRWQLQNKLGEKDYRKVVVAATNLASGAVITHADLEIGELPKAYVHPKNIPAAQQEILLGQRLEDAVEAGEPLLWGAFAPDGVASARMAKLVRKGERAVAIQVDSIASVGYFVLPGDRVDLFLSTRQTGGRIVMPVLQNVAVLAAGEALPGSQVAAVYNRVVVSVTPQEAEMLLLAQQAGKIYLLLRNENDLDAKADFPILRESEFVGSELRENVQRRRNKRNVRIIRGSG